MIRHEDQAAGLRGNAPDSLPRVVRLRPGNERGTHVVAVTSGKGGVGKTQVAANLAVGLAQEGKRVLVLDADLGLASLDLAFGVSPQHDLLSVLTGQRSIDEILVEAPCGVHLIPACPGRYDVANLDASQRARLWDLVEDAARDFDVLIIDTGAGIGSNAVGFASYADDVLLVTTPDPTALRDAYAMAKVLHRRSGVDRVRVVANQVGSEREGAEIHARMDGIVRRFLTLDLDYLGPILSDASVREGVTSGQPFVLAAPSSMAARCVFGLVRRLKVLGATEARPC
ncbi:MAG TPA: MinD/ParA family protein [Sandaracinaceae bacterium LLY-WYZ-13_1]|nr:MinD/ParA family protein [Sandaracinaceae bacterium LLY-WYZ-13_1]